MHERSAVAHGQVMEEFPPSRAPLFFLVGVVLLVVGTVLRAYPVASVAIRGLGLAVFVAGAFSAWLRLTNGGRVLVALPVGAWVVAFAVVFSGAPKVGEAIGVGAFVLGLVAFLAVVEPTGSFPRIALGRVNPAIIRTQRSAGRGECRVVDDAIVVLVEGKEARSIPLRELAPPRLEDRKAQCDLVLVDVFGDVLVRLRGVSDDERSGMRALSDDLEERLVAHRSP